MLGPLHRSSRLFYLSTAALRTLLVLHFSTFPERQDGHPVRAFGEGKLPALSKPTSCHGPRRLLLSDSPDDELRYGHPDQVYPSPFIGSQSTGRMQHLCPERNVKRFPIHSPPAKILGGRKFALKNANASDATAGPLDEFSGTSPSRRTATVIRGFSSFAFKPEDLWNLRSLIVETALHSGGEYAVFLLVHIQDPAANVFDSEKSDQLLESWYDAVNEHQTLLQVFQPLQLFALYHPGFDHYWQVELDQRFLGQAGKYLDVVSAFAWHEPRKQAPERATYPLNVDEYGTYDKFLSRVDRANRGQSRAWGPVRIPGVYHRGRDRQ
ncbi:biotin synthase-like protein [Hirsutella rhossiliensis]|uniref:Biotin synthase-like protein n=1 Tax=Hirsutella rhossiliensis TaxID=111463 RepID=A0A9P8SK00_9HYPO|nr:biotin synthase-like protein [Hirsutella rhossiliensis]KAH0963591.1 biotin synthase-like protein [Hirsutella rhossiliensis]